MLFKWVAKMFGGTGAFKCVDHHAICAQIVSVIILACDLFAAVTLHSLLGDLSLQARH